MIDRKIHITFDNKNKVYSWSNITREDDFKCIDDDIKLLQKEIKELSPVINLVNKKRKYLKWLKRLKELLIEKRKNEGGINEEH